MKEEYIPSDAPYSAKTLLLLFSTALEYFMRSEGLQPGKEADLGHKITEYCDKEVRDIGTRISDLWNYDCRFPDESVSEEYRSIKRYFFLLTKYWNAYRELLSVCGSAPIGFRPHPLGRIIKNLEFRIDVCLEKLSSNELTEAFAHLDGLDPADSEDFSVAWECGGGDAVARIDSAIEKQVLIYGNRIFNLTDQESGFLKLCNLLIKNYENETRVKFKSILDKIPSPQSSNLGRSTRNAANCLERLASTDTVTAIKKGEGDSVEFKETFQFNVHANRFDKSLRGEVYDAISAFMNSWGGILLIGIHDSGTITGLGPDYSLIGKADRRGGFQETLCQGIENAIGKEHFCLLSIHFESLEDKEICRLDIAEANGPVYLHDKEKNTDSLFIRRGNASVKLDTREALKYIKEKWNV